VADVDLGTAKGKIEVDASGLKKAGAEADHFERSLTGSADRSRQSLNLLAGAAAATGAAIVAGFGLAINTAADFEEKLSGIKAVSNATEKDMERLRKKALQLGADTSFSAGESASAMEELVKAGLSVEDVLNGAADATVNLAAAGEVDLVTAATIASNAMNQFGLSAEQMPRVADLIAGAANASAIDVNDFGLAMSQAGAVANLVGLSFDDLAVAIAAMGNAGIKGSDAGTSLKTFLSNLQPTTEKQIDLFYELGLAVEGNATAMNTMGNAFFDSEGNIKSMTEIAGILNKSLEGMSDAQKTATLEMLFGSDAIRAAAIIAGEGAGGFGELAGAMNEVTAADVAATRLDNFNGSVEKLKGSMETLLINVGTPFLGFLRTLVDYLTEGVNWFNTLTPETQTWAAAIVGGTGAVIGLLGAYGLILPYLRIFTGAIQLATVALAKNTLALLTNPWVLLAAAIAALVFGIIYAYKNFEGFREVVDQVVARVKVLGQAIWHWFMEVGLPALRRFADYFMAEIWPEIKRFAETAIAAIKRFAEYFVDEVLPRIVEFVQGAIKVIGQIVDWITGTAVPAIVGAWNTMVEVLIAGWNWFNENVISTITAFVQFVVAAFTIISDFVTGVFLPYVTGALEALWPVVEFIFRTIVSIITNSMNAIRATIQFVIDAILLIWGLFGDNLLSAITIAFDYIKGIVESVLSVIRGFIQVVTGLITGDWGLFLTGLRNIWEGIWNSISTVLTAIWDIIKLTIQTGIDAVKASVQIGLDAIKLVWDTIWGLISTGLSIIWDAIKTTVQLAIDAVKLSIETAINTIQTVWETVWGSIGNFIVLLWDGIKAIIKLAIEAVKDRIETVLNALKLIWDTVWGAISGAVETAASAVKAAAQPIIDFVQAAIEKIERLIELIPKIPKLPGTTGKSESDLIDLVREAEGNARGSIVRRPLLTWVGEGFKPEAIIPMTDDKRALALLAQSGLDRLVLANAGVDGATSFAQPGTSVTVTAPDTGPREAIHIDEYIVMDPTDSDMLLSQAEFALTAGRF
jgi:TP901 family phage tail tape measure protein